MANDSQLPALIGETLPEPQSFDGWGTDKLLTWLREAADDLSVAEKWTDALRLNVGRALYLLRELLPEGQYGMTVNVVAEGAGVTPRTLSNWRAAYESSAQLPPPKKAGKRTDAQRERRANETLRKQPIEARAEEIPNAHLSGLEPDEPTGKAAPPVTVPDAPPAPPSAKDETEAVMGHVRGLLGSDPAVLSRVVKRSVLADLEGLAKRAQQADPDHDGSRVVLLVADLVARFPTVPSEPYDAGVNRAIRDLLAEVERLRQPVPVPPAPPPPAATKIKPATAKKAPKPAAVKRPKKGEPCPHPRQAHVGVDMRGVTCSWCDARALTHVSLERMGQQAVAAR